MGVEGPFKNVDVETTRFVRNYHSWEGSCGRATRSWPMPLIAEGSRSANQKLRQAPTSTSLSRLRNTPQPLHLHHGVWLRSQRRYVSCSTRSTHDDGIEHSAPLNVAITLKTNFHGLIAYCFTKAWTLYGQR